MPVQIEKLEKGTIKQGIFDDLKSELVVWADFIKPTELELNTIARFTGIDVAELNDFLEETARPMLTNIERYSVIVLRAPLFEPKAISTQPVVVIISKTTNDIITLHKEPLRSIQRIRALPEKRKAAVFVKGPTYILFRLMDEIINTYHSVLENIDDTMSFIEKGIYTARPGARDILREIVELKKTLIYFHKALSANREVVAAIEKEYGDFLEKRDLSKFRLLYSDTTQLIELSATYRDILTSTLEVHLSMISNALNATMKRMTAWAALILVPSLIAGIYGMNFRYLPEIEWKYGYFFALGLMVTAIISLYYYFKRIDWL